MAVNAGLWLSRIAKAQALADKYSVQRKEILNLYRGEFFGRYKKMNADDELSEVNFVFEYEKLKKSGIYARNPHIFVRSYTGKWQRFAETMEAIINYYWRELQIKRKIKKAIQSAILTPPGWISVGYTGRIIRNEKVESQSGIMDETIKNDNVFVEYVGSFNIIWPDGYHDIRQSPFIVHRKRVKYVDILRNPIYNNHKYGIKDRTMGILDSKPVLLKGNDYLDISRDYDKDDWDREIELYQVWDRRDRKFFIIAKGYDKGALYETDWDDLSEGFNQYPLFFNEVPETDTDTNSYPMSDIVPMLPQLRDLSVINSAMLRHGKRAGTVIIGSKSLTEEERESIQSAGDVELIILESVSEDRIRTFTTPSLPADWYRLRSLVLEDLMRISQFSQLLGVSSGVETATESDNLRMGAALLSSDSVDIIEEFTIDIARALASKIWQYIDRSKISAIVGEFVNEEMWPSLPDDMEEAREIMQSELNFWMEAGSTRPAKDEAVERKQWTDAVGVLRANFPNRFKEDELARQYVKKIGFKDLENLIITNDDQEIAVAQQENQLLANGMVQLVSPNENHILHLQVHSQMNGLPGFNPTKEYDEHLLAHSRYLNMKTPLLSPQKGDSRISPVTTTPDILRQGTPQYSDLAGAAVNTNKGTGVNINR